MTDPLPNNHEEPGTPRWVKISAIMAIVLVVLVVVMMAAGHGPWRHMPGMAGMDEHPPATSLAQ